MAIGDKIKALRKENKISQEKLAHEIGVSRQIIGEWERGERTPTLVNANALATFFHVSVDVFFESSVENVTKNNSEKNHRRNRSKLYICLWISCFVLGTILVLSLFAFIAIFVLFILYQNNNYPALLYDDKLMYCFVSLIFVFIFFIVSIYFLHKETKKNKDK